MSKGTKILLGVLGAGLLLVLITGVWFISVWGKEARLRNAITAKQKDNESEFDNMWKKIAQTAEVTMEHKKALQEIFTSHAQARTGGKGQGGAIMTWIKESVPNANLDTMKNMQNIIIGSRDSWTMRQKELLDFKREHDNIIDVPPGSIVCAILGREKIDVTIVTSGRTERAFASGKDDDVGVFKKPQKAEADK
jgi:hypothetical protein